MDSFSDDYLDQFLNFDVAPSFEALHINYATSTIVTSTVDDSAVSYQEYYDYYQQIKDDPSSESRVRKMEEFCDNFPVSILSLDKPRDVVFSDVEFPVKVVVPEQDVILNERPYDDFQMPTHTSYSIMAPARPFEVVSENVGHGGLDYGTDVRNVFSQILGQLRFGKVIDFGSGERRYCNILSAYNTVVAHVDLKFSHKDFCECCNCPITPHVPDENYDTLLAWNVLTNLSVVALESLLLRLRQTRVVALWPVDINKDEIDPYHVLSIYTSVLRCGYVEEFYSIPVCYHKKWKFFEATTVPRNFDPSIFLDAKTHKPTKSQSSNVSVFVVGLIGGKIVGSIKNVTLKKKTVRHADFLAGGKVNSGESYHQALLREFDEEVLYAGDDNLQFEYVGYSDSHYTHGFVHYYIVNFSVSQMKLLSPKENRGGLMVINDTTIVRDDMIPFLHLLVLNNFISPAYCTSLENTWSMILRKRDFQLYEANQQGRISGDQPGYRPQLKFLKDKDKIGVVVSTRADYNYVTNVPLKVGDFVLFPRSYLDGSKFIYYNGRLHAHYELVSQYLGRVVRVESSVASMNLACLGHVCFDYKDAIYFDLSNLSLAFLNMLFLKFGIFLDTSDAVEFLKSVNYHVKEDYDWIFNKLISIFPNKRFAVETILTASHSSKANFLFSTVNSLCLKCQEPLVYGPNGLNCEECKFGYGYSPLYCHYCGAEKFKLFCPWEKCDSCG